MLYKTAHCDQDSVIFGAFCFARYSADLNSILFTDLFIFFIFWGGESGTAAGCHRQSLLTSFLDSLYWRCLRRGRAPWCRWWCRWCAHACVRYLDEGRQRSLSDGKVGSCVSPGQFPSPSPTARPRRERASIGFLVPFFLV